MPGKEEGERTDAGRRAPPLGRAASAAGSKYSEKEQAANRFRFAKLRRSPYTRAALQVIRDEPALWESVGAQAWPAAGA